MTTDATSSSAAAPPRDVLKLALAWLAVGLPLLWGVVQTLKKAMALFVAA
jgi:hypothetical protein